MNRQLRTNRLPEVETQGRVKPLPAELPCRGAFDAVVVGGGTAGAVAAIVAGQEGLSVAVLEPQGFLGGIGTGGGIHSYYHGIQTGVQVEIDRRTSEWNQRIGGKVSGFSAEAKKLALQELADAAGVRCFYGCFFAGAVLDGARIAGVAADGADGPFWLQAKVVVDATGDADVAAAAGAPFLFGREGDRAPQPYSLAPGHVRKTDTVGFRNFDAGYVDPTNARDQTRAQFEGRSHLKKEAYDAETRMIYVSPILGLRESRFIDAEYVVTLDDQRRQRRFPDAIARAKAHYDNHAIDYENESLEAALWVMSSSNWRHMMCHDVPYRCMLPKRVENLIVACRAVGMTHDAHHLFRMQRDMQALGEAAAVAAGVALREKTSVRAVDVKAVQRRLIERGALPPETLDGRGVGTNIEPDETLPKKSVAELFACWLTEKEGAAQLELLRRGAEAHAELRAALAGAEPGARLMAALNLGLQGLADGAELLRETVRARQVDATKARCAGNRWSGALFLLEKLGAREHGAIGLAIDLAQAPGSTLPMAVQAVRLLGRQASAAEGLAAVRAALKRDDIDGGLKLKDSSGGPNATRSLQDRRFELELAAAEALAKFNAADEARAIAERYTADPRALVRRYAREILERAAEPALAR
ncbi:MAG: FAD-dependent oxidoreductase [Planctomycetota bacterium]|nr:FAD-dependent oxidoreductase [Planctomycetota bacterium]